MEENQSSKQEFLELCNDILSSLRATAELLELQDEVVFIAMAGVYNKENNQIEAIYDALAPSDEVMVTGLDFLDNMIAEEIKNRPDEGTIDWWIDRIN